MKTPFWSLAILLAFTVLSHSACTGQNPDDLLQTGVVEFNNGGLETHSCFSILINYNIPKTGFQTALSTTNLDSYNPTHGLDYSVRGGQKGSSNVLAVSLITGDYSWKKITISYLATSRPDFSAGSFYVDLYSLYGCQTKNNNEVVVSHNIGKVPYGQNYQVQAFVSGVSSHDKGFNLDLSKIQYDSKSGELSLTVKSNAVPFISDLHLSYIIYNEAALPSNNPLEDDYIFTRTNGFQSSVAQIGVSSFDTGRINCEGSGCKDQCTTEKWCQKEGGRIFGNLCVICGPFEKIENKKCVPNCKINQIFVNGVCECAPGYMKLLGNCVFRCGVNEIWKNEACVCKQGTAKIDGVCRDCPANSFAAADGSKCICNKDYLWNPNRRTCDRVVCGINASPEYINDEYVCKCNENAYRNNKGVCTLIPKCPNNAVFDTKSESCICTIEKQYLIDGKCQPCGQFQQFNGSRCVCIENYILGANGCIPKCGNGLELVNGFCVCKENYIRIGFNQCEKCPAFTKPNNQGTECVCIDGYLYDTVHKKCVSAECRENAKPVQTDKGIICQCNTGTYLEDGWCKLYPTCPPNSKWNQNKLQCICQKSGEYLIDNVCKPCGKDEGWNGDKCVCANGLNRINGACRTCDPNSTYNGRDCICNLGFFGNRDKCEKCHPTCGKCNGPNANQCTLCSDVSYTLKDGTCKRNDPCPIGLYQDESSKACKPCSAYCANCVSENLCSTCIDGFELTKLSWGGIEASYCSEKCGDGKRFQLDCDDGNKRNKDGCNENCEVEKGWTCQGGSSIKASTCVQYAPSRSFVSLTGTVNLFGRVVQGVRLSYIPPVLTANDCAQCSKLLWVRVISSSVIPGVRVNYLPKSKYQFLTEFDFNGLFSIPVFTISIQINPDFAEYFSESDLAQIEVKTIDPSVLKKAGTGADKIQTLSLGALYDDEDIIDIPYEAQQYIFS